MDVVERGGVRALRAIGPSEFIVALGETLPDQFTLEFDLITRNSNCCSGEELAFEASPVLDRGDQSAQVLWHHSYSAIMGGGRTLANSTVKTPSTLEADFLGKLVRIQVSIEGPSFKLFANDTRLQNVPSLVFRRDKILRVFLGGVDDKTAAVFLARIRVAAKSAAVAAAPGAAAPGAAAPAGASIGPPVGAGVRPVTQPPVAGTPITLRVDSTTFAARIIQGGSPVAFVVSTSLTGAFVNKHPSAPAVEPLVLDVPPASPMQSWINSSLAGATTRKNGAVSGGIIPAGQQLAFTNAMITSVTVPALDAASGDAGYLRVTVAPEQTAQTALTGGTVAARARVAGPSQVWVRSAFRFTMGDLETSAISRIESFGATIALATDQVGAQRVATSEPVKLGVSNLVLTIAESATSGVARWLTWLDDFVLKGNNGDDKERTFAVDLLNAAGQVVTTIKGSGVGIIAARRIANPNGAGTSLQVELYVERLEIAP
jgi:hypothetical protein